jgi:hypothetical protein
MKKVRKFSPMEAIWLAAVIDGEGSIGLYHGADGRITIVQMGNTSSAFVKEVRRIIGCGSTIWRIKFTSTHKGRKPMFHYTLKGSKRCLSVLQQIVKYLIIKKKRAQHIINEIESKPFGAWTKARRMACSRSVKAQWKNPRIRANRLKGMKEAQRG